MTDDTESRLAKALEEQNRLLRKADRRGGCLWNIVMVLLFGVFYLAWLAGKRIVKVAIWAARIIWRALVWLSARTRVALAWVVRTVSGWFRRG